MSSIKPPEYLDMHSNLAENWKKFIQKFELFLVATETEENPRTDKQKVSTLLLCIGDDALDVYNNVFKLTEDEKYKYDCVLSKFEEYCAPKKNTVFERYKFYNVKQREGQSFDSFLTELKQAVKTCKFKENNLMIRDRVVSGILDRNLQERLLSEPNLSLKKAAQFCRTAESSGIQVQLKQELNRQMNPSINNLYEGQDYKSRNSCDDNTQGLENEVKGMEYLAVDGDRPELVYDVQNKLSNVIKYETELADDEYDDVPDNRGDVSLIDLPDIDEEDDGEKGKRYKQTTIPEKKNEKGETPIIPACAKGNIKLVLDLLNQGHSVNAGDASGWTALHEASNYGYVDIVNVLLDHGADINNRGGPYCEGITPLLDAANCGNLEVIDCLLDRGASPLLRTNNGETPLDLLVACRNRVIMKAKKELEPSKLAHFWSIVDRLSTCLRKAGHTPSVPLTDVQEILKSGKKTTDNYLGIIPENDRRRKKSYINIDNNFVKLDKNEKNIEVEDASIFGAVEDNNKPIYQLRNHNKRQRGTEMQCETQYGISQPSLGENSTNERLEENVIYKPKKRYFIETTKRNDSPVKDVNFEDKDKMTRNDNKLPDFNPEFEFNKNIRDLIPHSDEDLNNTVFTPGKQNNIVKNEPSTSEKKNYQSKFEHQGFIGTKSNSPSTDESVSTPVSQSLKREEIVKNINRTIKVRIENRLFLVPIPANEENLKLKWLVIEAARRYQKLERVNPILNLATDDGALLDENDPIELLDGFQEVLGNVVGWSTDTLIKIGNKSVKKNNQINKEIKRMGGRNRNKNI